MTKVEQPTRTKRRQSRKFGGALVPLDAWRTVNARLFDRNIVVELRKSLETIAMIDEPTWRAAATGDASAAIGLALRLAPGKSSELAYQLIMTALVACAAEGDAAACIVMVYMLRNRVDVSPLDRQLAASWAMRAIEIRANHSRHGATG
jgi:hypothetical protein